jgi:uncharacterized protein YjbI with pentapeptide repeats/uncharacterized protein
MSRHFIFPAIVSAAVFAAGAALLLPNSGSAAPKATEQPAGERNALDVCIAVADPDMPSDHRTGIDPQRLKPNNLIEGQDWSGQDLAGKSLSGKVLVDVKLKGANLRGADLTQAVICGSDLTGADLTGAHLDRTLIGGSTKLSGANFTSASARAMRIADASGDIRIDRADLREASIICDPDDSVRCLGNGVTFVSMIGADLRGAVIDRLCCSAPGLATTQLDGVTTHLNGYADTDMDFVQLAAGAGKSGRITFMPDDGYSGRTTKFTGEELRQLAPVFNQMQSASARPSFDCSRARTKVERAICADPKLAALDSALSWLWERVEHTPERIAAQKKWLGARVNCPPPAEDLSVVALSQFSFASSVDREGCIGLAYAERIKQLAPVSAPAAIDGGTYTTDRPLEPPQGRSSALAKKFLMARGFRQDEITVQDLGNGARKISGYGSWANGHQCGFEAKDAETKRVGAQFQIIDDSAAPSDDRYSISFVITPQVVIRAGGNKQFQCGARGGWSDAYFRQPDSLVSEIKSRHDSQ